MASVNELSAKTIMPSVNEVLADEAVQHAIDTTGYSNWVVRRLLSLLMRADADLTAQLQTALQDMDPDSFSVQRLEGLLSSVRALNRQLYERLQIELTGELRRFAEAEASYHEELFRTVLPPQISVTTVSIEQVYAAAFSRPFQGRLLSEWMQSLEQGQALRIRDTLRIGYIEGKTIQQMVREIRGTKARAFKDGILEIDRRNADSVVRTAISHTAASAREAFYEANADLMAGVVWKSTLDSRTTTICALRDGKQYTMGTYRPIGHSLPWLSGPGKAHWGCRSVSTPVTKSWKELTGVDIEEFTPQQRSSMDGLVPADQTYGQWLKKQSAARQDEILGPQRGKLLRDGGLTLDRFANDRGLWLSLEELKARNASAFKRAGLE